eukprot:gene9685-11481_t
MSSISQKASAPLPVVAVVKAVGILLLPDAYASFEDLSKTTHRAWATVKTIFTSQESQQKLSALMLRFKAESLQPDKAVGAEVLLDTYRAPEAMLRSDMKTVQIVRMLEEWVHIEVATTASSKLGRSRSGTGDAGTSASGHEAHASFSIEDIAEMQNRAPAELAVVTPSPRVERSSFSFKLSDMQEGAIVNTPD